MTATLPRPHPTTHLSLVAPAVCPSVPATCSYLYGATVSYCQLLSATVSYWQPLLATLSYCQKLSVGVSYCQLLSVTVIYCQLLSITVSYCQLLSVTVSYCQLLSATCMNSHCPLFNPAICGGRNLALYWPHILGDSLSCIVNVLRMFQLVTTGYTVCKLS